MFCGFLWVCLRLPDCAYHKFRNNCASSLFTSILCFVGVLPFLLPCFLRKLARWQDGGEPGKDPEEDLSKLSKDALMKKLAELTQGELPDSGDEGDEDK